MKPRPCAKVGVQHIYGSKKSKPIYKSGAPLKIRTMSAESQKIQVAALPYRRRENLIEVLLVTSRETKRWIIPKGWPMPNLKDFTAAKREAREEAGVTGQIGKIEIGRFEYLKRLKDGCSQECSVVVYPLKVEKLLQVWKEKKQRTRKWFSAEEACSLVHEPFLQDIIQNLQQKQKPSK